MPARLSCPYCHVSNHLEMFDHARSTTDDYLVCIECDSTFLAPFSDSTVVQPQVNLQDGPRCSPSV